MTETETKDYKLSGCNVPGASTGVYFELLTEHVDNLPPAVVDRADALVVQPPDCRPPDLRPVRLSDHDDHVGVEPHQQQDRDHEEDDEG